MAQRTRDSLRDDNDGLAVGWEERAWTPVIDQPMSRRERLAARGPYRAAVVPEIAGLRLNLPPTVIAEAEDALVEISRFDAELAAALPASDGELAPLASILLRTESASSSQIEGITAGAKALALAEIAENAGTNATAVAANVAAMQRAIALSDDLSLDAILDAHAALTSADAWADPGRLRRQQVWVGGGATPHTAQFVPAHHDRVAAAMDDLIDFARRTDLPGLPHVAIAHAQFETIHPFNDGNGRTGRMLVHAMLRRAGTTRRLTVPVSAGLLTDTGTYFDALTAYRAGDAAPIVSRFAAASFAAIGNGRVLVAELSATYAAWRERSPSRAGSAGRRLLPLLLSQPAVNVRYVEEHLAVSQPAAKRAIDQLVEAGVLTAASASRRNRVWVADEVLTSLEDFASRARRQ